MRCAHALRCVRALSRSCNSPFDGLSMIFRNGKGGKKKKDSNDQGCVLLFFFFFFFARPEGRYNATRFDDRSE